MIKLKSLFRKTNLDGIVEGSLALDVLCIDIGPMLEEKFAQLNALHAVDQTGATVVVRPLDVRIVGHLKFSQKLDLNKTLFFR